MSTATATERSKRWRRKNLILDQDRIDRARRILGVATETETITRALDTAIDLSAFRREVGRPLGELLGRGGFVDRFDARSGRRRRS